MRRLLSHVSDALIIGSTSMCTVSAVLMWRRTESSHLYYLDLVACKTEKELKHRAYFMQRQQQWQELPWYVQLVTPIPETHVQFQERLEREIKQ